MKLLGSSLTILAVLATTRTVPAAEPTRSAAATASDPCAGWVKALCEKSGEESQTCSQVKAVAGLLSPAACKAAAADTAFSIRKLAEAHATCEQLAARLCKDLGPSETCKLVQKQTKSFPPERCKMMVDRYDEVLADLQRMEKSNKPLDAQEQAALVTGTPPSFGARGARVTLVIFSDFQCPYCSRAADTTQKVKAKYGKQVYFVFRQFPLSFHQNAQVAAEASLAAHAQGKFWAMHDKLFANQGALGREKIDGYAKEIGLDVARFKKALDGGDLTKAVDDDLALGAKVNVNGTPTMFLNGTRIQNPTDFEAVAAAIDGALQGASK